MRALAVPVALLLLAGCLGNDPVAPAGDASTDANASEDGAQAGICVIGVNSPCNAPQWRDPNATGAPRAIPVVAIRVSSPILDAKQEVELVAEVGALRASELSLVFWSFGDGATATGPAVRHAWVQPGSYAVTASVTTAAGDQVQGMRRVGVRLNETFTQTIVLGDGGPCLAPGTTCGEHKLELPAGAHSVVFSVSTPGAAASQLTVQVVSPAEEMVADGAEVSVENPAAGTWALTVHGFAANAEYRLTALAVFPGES